ncbi:unnamed protein product [Heterosigma akashiwo]|mmetsp:Transcript_3723/g.5985  ORF Transcript_3723/g.5985 Transcript_3723/m.5985 type:complete len:206 (-) Transcript_3723:323-940(-)|eukprot:CAMPEP_0194583498 /NCGR_PEP_ID=MMETSP0292-20121207/16374_1 /TAXON_ID=39354 /ORGANISM="Heterosigma akashiwo, Strain CCMP2393" /LENGTH=205 /DNA_ID=CAMNT_0039438129 /DNA_START=16 /DNA_END=633 /DNA_ORIENTATION=+
MLFPPVNFGMVEEDLYRSALPTEINFPFLETLQLKKIIFLYPDKDDLLDVQFRTFLEDQGIELECLGDDNNKRVKSYSPIEEETVIEALRIVVDSSNYPLLVTCATGKHRTGAVIACLRKIQKWNLTAIFEEYRRFTGKKIRVQNEHFIELFDTELVEVDRKVIAECPPFLHYLIKNDQQQAREEAMVNNLQYESNHNNSSFLLR